MKTLEDCCITPFSENDITKLLPEPPQEFSGKNNLPIYIKELLRQHEFVYNKYVMNRSMMFFITFYELQRICKQEIAAFEKTGKICEPWLPEETLMAIDLNILTSRVLLHELKDVRFRDVLFGYLQVKDVMQSIVRLKQLEYNAVYKPLL